MYLTISKKHNRIKIKMGEDRILLRMLRIEPTKVTSSLTSSILIQRPRYARDSVHSVCLFLFAKLPAWLRWHLCGMDRGFILQAAVTAAPRLSNTSEHLKDSFFICMLRSAPSLF